MDLDLGRRSIVDWAESSPDDADADFVPAEQKFLVEMPIATSTTPGRRRSSGVRGRRS